MGCLPWLHRHFSYTGSEESVTSQNGPLACARWLPKPLQTNVLWLGAVAPECVMSRHECLDKARNESVSDWTWKFNLPTGLDLCRSSALPVKFPGSPLINCMADEGRWLLQEGTCAWVIRTYWRNVLSSATLDPTLSFVFPLVAATCTGTLSVSCT